MKSVLDDDEDCTDGGTNGDDGTDDAALEGHAEPAPIQRFRRTAVGTALAAGMLGLADALEGRKEPTPAIVENWAGGQPFKEPIVLRLDPDHPEDSIVMVRPWLKRESGEPPSPTT